ncbi:MAG: RNA-binding domain-containing protein, partial [Patescibacteria group bacterium]
MNKAIVIKKSPVIIIRNLLVLQFLVIGFYFLAGILANYGELYEQFTFGQGVSYEIAKNLFIAIGESFLIALIFLRWFFTTYSVYPEMIIKEWGIVFKKRRTTPLEKPVSVSCHFSPLAKIFRYGTIIINKNISINHVPDPENYCELILEQQQDESAEKLEDLIQSREHEKLEFKTSFRWDARENKVNKALEKMTIKTIAAFLNSGGGNLIIGVDDKGQVLGLDFDYTSLAKKDADGFENHFTNIFKTAIGSEFRNFIKFAFHKIDGKEICQ